MRKDAEVDLESKNFVSLEVLERFYFEDRLKISEVFTSLLLTGIESSSSS